LRKKGKNERDTRKKRNKREEIERRIYCRMIKRKREGKRNHKGGDMATQRSFLASQTEIH